MTINSKNSIRYVIEVAIELTHMLLIM